VVTIIFLIIAQVRNIDIRGVIRLGKLIAGRRSISGGQGIIDIFVFI